MSQPSSVWSPEPEPPSHPRLSESVDVDVAVVGAGITGLTTALLAQRNGTRVAVLEAEHVAAGTTGCTTGKVTSQHRLIYDELIRRHGEQKARLYADANQRAIDLIAQLADGIDCGFTRAPAYLYTRARSHLDALKAEHDAARRLDLPAHLTSEIDLPFTVELALRFDAQAHFDPVRYSRGLAASIVEGGGQIYEHSRVVAVDERHDKVVLRTDGGEVRAEHVVVATLLPIVDNGGFFAKARPTRAYGIAARLRGGAPAGMHINVGSPTRSTRPWANGQGANGQGTVDGLIIVGENHPTGDRAATPGRWGELERWAREHFEVESFDYRWSAQDFTAADRVPYVGRSPRMKRTFVATGFNKWGLTNGTAAAVVLADLLQGREHSWLHLYDATRIGDARTILKLVNDNVHVGRRFVQDRVTRLRAPSIDHLQPGDGGIFVLNGETVGAYRHPDGTIDAVSVTCTHMGCTVKWNAAERSWDCPCHGSRFSTDGTVLSAPATKALKRIEVTSEERPVTVADSATDPTGRTQPAERRPVDEAPEITSEHDELDHDDSHGQ